MKFFILFLILILINKNLQSSELFESSFYDIEFISNNIENEKIITINKIKEQTFISILKKTLSNNEFSKIQKILNEDFINNFVKNVIINDEKIINNKYLSKIKVNFNKQKIINFFREKKIPYVDYYPAKFLLIIYEEDEINKNLFTKNNSYYSYLNNNFDSKSIFKIPNLDINDRFLLKKEDLKSRNIEKIIHFSEKYNLKEIIVLYAKKNKNKVIYNVMLLSDKKILETEIIFDKYEFEELFKILQNQTINNWKLINQIQNDSLNVINCKINYFNMLELKEIKRNLKKISIIKDLNIKNISYKKIEYEMYYFGNFKTLFNLFSLNQLIINNINNECIIKLK